MFVSAFFITVQELQVKATFRIKVNVIAKTTADRHYKT